MSSYYELRVRMASLIENELLVDGAPRSYFYYRAAKDLGLGKKAVDEYINGMIEANAAIEKGGRVVRK